MNKENVVNKENTVCCFVAVLICAALAYALGYMVALRSSRTDAVRVGAARYEVNKEGKVSFHWNNQPESRANTTNP